MSNLFLLPDGNALSPWLIKSVQLFKGKGVVCSDAQKRVVAYIKVTDEEKGCLIRDLLIKVANDGARATQPDWSFLNDEVAG